MYVLQRESDRICGLGKRRKNERMPKTFRLRQAIRRKQGGKAMKHNSKKVKLTAKELRIKDIVLAFTILVIALSLSKKTKKKHKRKDKL